ncbi:DUF1542 domain-containing protein [Acinetobacter sp. ANC 4173]|uniref:DUF1542 domain-containing protein n=1 Tax=Acinetobacter sp. ANC 4173 TaxID=2529837 RepID=UPI001039F503|nr:DUF1542 domain-containing protein [Acinetobacter sp. ANC 4173]TCB81672.1 hypothetical protein E0H94_03900 [Acinetobacter sp. ANC 4173]
MKILWVVLAGLLVLIWLFFPTIFNWWALNIWHVPSNELGKIGDLGPIGDIYGSLNTLFTSVTLVIVLYSVFLQRQANKDARDAVTDQLQQAKDATAEQLQQAKDATNEQLQQARDALDAQLNQARILTDQQITNAKELAHNQMQQTRSSTLEQMEFAQKTHEVQVQEGRSTFFSNQFFALLNYKNERLNSLKLTDLSGVTRTGYEIFPTLNSEYSKICFNTYKDNIDKLDSLKVKEMFEHSCINLNNNNSYYEIFSYFSIYNSIIQLVRMATIQQHEKLFFWTLIRDSMSSSEQISIFYLAPIWPGLHNSLQDSYLFNLFGTGDIFYEKYGCKFYIRTAFNSQQWAEAFDRHEKRNLVIPPPPA